MIMSKIPNEYIERIASAQIGILGKKVKIVRNYLKKTNAPKKVLDAFEEVKRREVMVY